MADTTRTPESRLGAPVVASPLPFLLASSSEWHVGQGVGAALEVGDAGDVVSAAAALLDASEAEGAPPVLMGALPFAQHARPQLYRPARWTRTLPDPALLRATFPPTPDRTPAHWRLSTRPSRARYAQAVAAALEAIAAPGSDLRKVVLTRSLVLEADTPIVVGDIAARLLVDRSVTTFVVPLPACATGGSRALVGATPELLLSRRGLSVRSRPLAGSAKRATDPVADTQAANELLRSDKDRREHATVIEWIADRLAPFCRKLHVPRSPSLVSTASMWHLATDIHGELADAGATSLALARTLHPTPAVCGVPFDRASDLIERLEAFDRRFYTGAVGWCDRSGDGDWFVAIRCADVCGRVAHLYAGAGIVAGSVPEREAAETAAKFRALLDAINPAHIGEPIDGAL